MADQNPFMNNFWQSMQAPPETMALAPIPMRAPQANINKAQQAMQSLKAAKEARAADNPIQDVERQRLLHVLKMQQDDAQGLRNQMDVVGQQDAQQDFSPLLALIDSWSGSKIAPSYKPFTAEDKETKMMQLRKLAGDAENDVGKTQLGVLGLDVKSDNGLMNFMKAMAGERGNEARERLDTNHGKEVMDQMNKMNDKLQSDRVNLSGAEAALKSGDLQSVVANLGPIARTISREVGVMNEGDINRVLVDTIGKDWKTKIAYFTNNPGVKIDPAITRPLLKLLGMAKEGLYMVAKQRLETQKKQYSFRKEMKGYMATGGDGVIDEQIRSLSDLRNDEVHDKPKSTPLSLWVEATPEMRAKIVQAEEAKKQVKK